MVGVVTSLNNMPRARSLTWIHHTDIPKDKMNANNITKNRTREIRVAAVEVLVPITVSNHGASSNDLCDQS